MAGTPLAPWSRPTGTKLLVPGIIPQQVPDAGPQGEGLANGGSNLGLFQPSVPKS